VRALSVALLAAVVSGCGGSSPTDPPSGPDPTPPPPPPNLVLLLTDDLDVMTTLDLPRIGELVADRGVTFSRAYVAFPVCGPSRASILTGQYAHNHGVSTNSAPSGGFAGFRRHEGATIATWLQAAGYRTALVGKYINDYPNGAPDNYVPPGWDEWHGHLSAFEDGRYYNYWVNDNGRVTRYGAEPEDYSADVEAQRAVRFIEDSAGRPEPLFLYLAPEAPHRPATYAARHGGEFRDAGAPRVPSFNEPDVSDKPVGIRQPPLTDAHLVWLDELQRWRLRSMRAVEEMMATVLRALDNTGRLGSTYFIFTSDNGLLMGQHRYPARKNNFYEESTRVPLMIRGPGLGPRTEDRLVLSIDLAPTLLELAGAPVPASVDGRSLVPLLHRPPPESWRTDVLVEAGSPAPGFGLRTPDWSYIENTTGEIELYDMRRDRWQLESLHRDAEPALLQSLHERVRALRSCRGAGCRD
jgi:arylsulfatase A-like enzyme